MPTDAAERRRRTERAGRHAERVALLWLVLRGYRILARRYHVQGGEIDIVAKRGGTIAFVEVKARPARDQALTAVTAAKRRRLARAAMVWLSRNPWASGYSLRGDLLAVAPWCWPCLVEGAIPLQQEAEQHSFTCK